jgi:hypothetical protein
MQSRTHYISHANPSNVTIKYIYIDILKFAGIKHRRLVNLTVVTGKLLFEMMCTIHFPKCGLCVFGYSGPLPL